MACRFQLVTTLQSNGTHYRRDIDGLRGIAVLAVVLFHANLGLPGGYLGVDIFFVISGYLITGIIIRQVRESNFRLFDFMVRRIRRIAPAALAMTSCVLAVGLVVLRPEAMDQLATSAFCQQFFLSNVYFSMISDYFAAPSELMPLLHTWTLSLEEQFYVLLPLALPWILRRRTNITRWLLWTLTVLSFATFLWASARYPVAAFFLLPTRVWEFAVGSLLAMEHSRDSGGDLCAEQHPPRWTRWQIETFAASGLAMLVFAFVGADQNFVSSRYEAALPVMAAVLLIAIGKSHQSLAHHLLSSRILVSVGLISYSLYLWHWPILSFLQTLLDHPSLSIRLLAVATSLLIAVGSWRYIERPARVSTWIKPWQVVLTYGISTLFIAGISLCIAKTNGLPSRLDSATLDAIENLKIKHQPLAVSIADIEAGSLPKIGCLSVSPTFLVWGDSHALAASEMISRFALKHNVGGWLAATGGNPPLLGLEEQRIQPGRDHGIRNRNEAVIRFIQQNNVQYVLLVAAWQSYRSEEYVKAADPLVDSALDQDMIRFGLGQTMESLKMMTRRVVVLRQSPVQEFNVGQMRLNQIMLGWPTQMPAGLTSKQFNLSRQKLDPFFQQLEKDSSNDFKISIIDPARKFFDDRGESRLLEAGVSFYVDTNHLTSKGVDAFYGDAIDQMFKGLAISSEPSSSETETKF